MRIIQLALPLLLLAGCAARQAVPNAAAPSAMDAQRLLDTPLAQTIGEAEAQRIRALAVVNGLLRHCRLRWEGYFGRMASQQRDEFGRSDEAMRRIALWHGYWLGSAERSAERDRVECGRDLQITLRDRAEELLRASR